MYYYFFFFNDTATTEIYTLSLHDALPIFDQITCSGANCLISQYSVNKINQDLDLVKQFAWVKSFHESEVLENLHKADRKSTRLNSSHSQISYAVFCLKKKKKLQNIHYTTK